MFQYAGKNIPLGGSGKSNQRETRGKVYLHTLLADSNVFAQLRKQPDEQTMTELMDAFCKYR
jgi:hypothetical protein